MSDNATLVERLRARTQLHYSGIPEVGYDHVIHDPLCQEAADRIAELEAELAKAHLLAGDLFHRTRDLEIIKAKANARIAELEAENASIDTLNDDIERLTAEVTHLTRHLGEATGRIETDGKLIAELEAERDKWQMLAHLRGDHSVERAKTLTARVTELEAERDRLRFALEIIRTGETTDPLNMAKTALSRGEAYAYRSEDHGPGKKS